MKQLVIILLLICWIHCKEEGIKIGVVTISAQGHISPLRPLLAELQSRSHEIYFFSSEQARKKVPTVDRFFSVSNTSLEQIQEQVLAGDQPTISEFPLLFSTTEKAMLPGLIQEFEELKRKGEKPDILICDFLTLACMDISVKYEIPAVISFPGIYRSPWSAGLWTPQFFAPFLQDDMPYPWARLGNLVFTTVEKYLGWSLSKASNEVRASFSIPPISSVRNAWYWGNLVLVHSFPPLNPPSSILLGTEYFIGFPKQPVNQLEDHLNGLLLASSRPVVFVSMGTISKQTKELLDSMIEAFLASPEYLFIWSIRDDIKSRTEKFKSIAVDSNIRLFSWVDQNSLLHHEKLAVFFTHGGFNSLVESVQAGKPMLCMPFFADQPQNCNRVASLSLGHAIRHESFNLPEFKEKLDALIKQSIYKEKVSEMAAYSALFGEHGLETAANLLEVVAKFGDSALISPDTRLPWYALLNFDLIVLYSAFISLSPLLFCYCCCFPRKRSVKPLPAKKTQ